MGKKIGFVGCGNMASAIIRGIVSSGQVKGEEIIASALNREKLKRTCSQLGIVPAGDNREAAGCPLVFLTVKPQFYSQVIQEIKGALLPDAVVVTVAPGFTLERMAQELGEDRKVVRTMPNIPASVGEGMTAVCRNPLVGEEEFLYIRGLLDSFGKTEEIAEYMMEAASAAAGCSPAFVDLFIEALADGAVMGGLPREKAYRFAAQAVLGSAKMILETGLHPGVLKDMVCSPMGTTIEGVAVLEGRGFRGSVIEAMRATMQKSLAMQKKG